MGSYNKKNKRRKATIFALCVLCYASAFAQNNAAIQKLIKSKGFENATVGFCALDLSGKTIAAHNRYAALTPASTMKVVTTAAAIEILGENYTFKTVLSTDKENPQHIIVQGYGDPTLGSEHFGTEPTAFLNVWANKIKNTVNPQKPVELEIRDDYFGYSGVSAKWPYEDLGNYYAAGTYGISVFDNLYRLYFDTSDTSVAPRIIKTEPEVPGLKFFNLLETNSEGKDNGYVNGEIFSNRRTLNGDIPEGRKSFSIKGDIPDPGLYLGQMLSRALSQNGIQTAKIYTARDYATGQAKKHSDSLSKPFYTHISPPLKDIIRVVNVKSNNHYTEHLIRILGKSGNAGSGHSKPLADGIAKVKTLWASKGLNTGSLFMYDGCGLSPADKISAGLLCDILLYMKNKSRYSAVFQASLPQAGKDGTVKNFLKGTRLEGKVFVKSGSIADVQCYTGYYINGDRKYIFAIMANNYTCSRSEAVKVIETLLLSVLQ
jgi:D-alanyl-D-alanine carboxypeptidase/D-alanyl-D-alanine-endopeptidase (penicillin-binding protein 4)